MNTSTDSALLLPSLLHDTMAIYPNSNDSRVNLTVTADSGSFHRFVIRSLSLYALVLVIVGTLGNLLTIVILCRRNLRRFVTMRYLIAVSVCDTISLYGWNLNNFYKFTISSNDTNLEEKSLALCRIMSYLTFVGLQLSSWCLTAVSLDRCLSLYFLTWKHHYGKLSRTKYHIAILTGVCLLLNSHILLFNGYHTGPPHNAIRCYRTRTNRYYIYPEWERIHLVVYNLCPFIIMLSCNTYIIHVTVRSARVRTIRRKTNASGKSTSSNSTRHRQLSLMLMLVTFAFVLLTLPSCIYFVFFRHRMPTSEDSRRFRHMVQICLGSVQFTSHAINFFLYCFSATNFREELRGFVQDLCFHRASAAKAKRPELTSVRLTTLNTTKIVKHRLNTKSTSDHLQIERQQNKPTEDNQIPLLEVNSKAGLSRDIVSMVH